ncbi:MarR family transcriptional regulator [Microbacterium hominis]|uniref:MarR family winged helix-turn-helix transcriptional regulator n=1 Tax=Microbacterium hominis TaxID=162426 RepID=UPI00168BA514|nr:MarR family transcriptional regulator [Microbacterium hominis]QOC26770.1 MarR family transcriptional regulator [Microbacterium hominis]QOC27948.1 MarR family transcriptional regulator [Microbacterium hominis]
MSATELRYAILAAQREGNRQLARALAPLDVTPSQAEVITVLADYGPITLKGLGSLLVCESGSPSRLVDSLVKRGLVDRIDTPVDRRQVLLQLTKEGRRLRPHVEAAEATIDANLRDVFGDELVRDIVQQIRKFLAGSNVGAALTRRFNGK